MVHFLSQANLGRVPRAAEDRGPSQRPPGVADVARHPLEIARDRAQPAVGIHQRRRLEEPPLGHRLVRADLAGVRLRELESSAALIGSAFGAHIESTQCASAFRPDATLISTGRDMVSVAS